MRDFSEMSHGDRTRLFELATFQRFCNACDLEIAPGAAVQQLEPPAPDILATIVGQGPIAFELVCLDDDASQERLNLMADAQSLTRQYHRELEPGRRAAFDAAFGDALMMIAFVPTSGKRGVRKALPGLFEALMRLSPGAKGQAFGYDNAPPDGVERVNIARDSSIDGAEFTMLTGGYVGPLNLAKLEEKLGKTYQSDAPVELLAYAAEISRQSDDEEIPQILDRLMPDSAYRRVWIFEQLQRKAICHVR
jgi:hypothetical protein